jgi:enoyl-CoA hydratase
MDTEDGHSAIFAQHTAAYADPIDTLILSPLEYMHVVADPFIGERLVTDGIWMLVVDGAIADNDLPTLGSLPVVVAYLGTEVGGKGPLGADLVVDAEHLDRLEARVRAHPMAATSLVVLLRQTEHLAVEHGLAAESAVYSMLQSGSEFAQWRTASDPCPGDESGAVVAVTRDRDALEIFLNRPRRHNAITRQLRDELCNALRMAIADDSIAAVTLSGRGPSFSSGGDLAEFGMRTDPAVAHHTRLAQSPARLIHDLRDRITVRVHGSTLGGGIEMASFAGRIVAHPSTHLGLPEINLGLIPGAGGTVGVARRIGRQRTAALALATEDIDAQTALRWGLVDALESP